jgi:hypothetical protein
LVFGLDPLDPGAGEPFPAEPDPAGPEPAGWDPLPAGRDGPEPLGFCAGRFWPPDPDCCHDPPPDGDVEGRDPPWPCPPCFDPLLDPDEGAAPRDGAEPEAAGAGGTCGAALVTPSAGTGRAAPASCPPVPFAASAGGRAGAWP